MSKLNRFIDTCTTKYDKFTLGLKAGYIDEEGCICSAQMGMLDTFAIGMPVYGEDDQEVGRLSLALFKNLNYANDKIDMEIPVEYWRVEGYKGKRQSIKTYHQVQALSNNLSKGEQK